MLPTQGRPITYTKYYISWTSLFFDICSIKLLLWLVVQGENSLSETLLKRINDSGQVYMIPAKLRDMYVIRFAVCSRYTELSDIQASCQEIRRHASDVVKE